MHVIDNTEDLALVLDGGVIFFRRGVGLRSRHSIGLSRLSRLLKDQQERR